MKGLKRLLLAGGLATWYAFTSISDTKSVEEKYPLPAEIVVLDSSVPYETREVKGIITYENGQVKETSKLEKVIKTEDIDFSEDFKIETQRYSLIKDDDWLPSRIIGYLQG